MNDLTKKKLDEVEEIAKYLYQMAGRVKGGEAKPALDKGPGYEAFKAAGGLVKEDLPPEEVPVVAYDNITDEMMASIPF